MDPMLRHLATATLLCLCLGACPKPGYLPRDGDVVFQTSRSRQSLAIQLATHSRYSHMGIVYLRHGRPFVFEAVGPVRLTPLRAWIARGVGHHFVVKRLRHAGSVLTPKVLARMKQAGEKLLGRRYDLAFGWSDTRVYCSELVWKVYQRGAGIRLCPTRHLKDFDLADPRVARKLRQRYGKHPPLEETVVSPADIFASKKLVTVYRR